MRLSLEGEERSSVGRVAEAAAAAGGRAYLVGGWVRDRLMGRPSRDLDLEIHGLARDEVERMLRELGPTSQVGRSFPVWLVRGIPAQISFPRAEGIERAARHRDLRINAMAFDPLTEVLIDPLDGRADLEGRWLRAADAETFAADPLRGLRVARLGAVLEMQPDAELVGLCAALDLSAVSPERIFGELEKLLLQASRPSAGLEILRSTRLLRFLPELAALVGVPQDPRWHPEGDVWIHTEMVVDEAARLRSGDALEDSLLMFSALCHDFGKPKVTVESEGRIRSPGHEDVGMEIAGRWLEALRAPGALVDGVRELVRAHLAPALLDKAGASDKAYRRLARRLEAAGVGADLLERVARADHLGRTTSDALARRFPAGDAFRERMNRLYTSEQPAVDVVLGRHVLARGIEPGRRVGEILAVCREIQDETGSTDPDAILEEALRRAG